MLLAASTLHHSRILQDGTECKPEKGKVVGGRADHRAEQGRQAAATEHRSCQHRVQGGHEGVVTSVKASQTGKCKDVVFNARGSHRNDPIVKSSSKSIV